MSMSTLAILLALVAAALAGIVGNIAASTLERHLNSSSDRFRFLNRKQKLLIFFGLFVILSLPSIYIQAKYQSLSSDTTNLPVTPNPIPVAQENEILVVLAEFKNDSHFKYDIAGSVKLALDEGLQQCAKFNSSDTKIRLERSNQAFNRTQAEDARELGKRYGAMMVIWGYYDDGGFFPSFTVVPTRTLNIGGMSLPVTAPTSPSPNLDTLANPSKNLGFYAHHDIPETMAFLTKVTIGQILFLRGEGCVAQSYIQSAIRASEKIDINSIRKELELAYQLKAWDDSWAVRIQGGAYGWIETARDYTRLIELNPISLYYCGRGVALEQLGKHEDAIADFTKCFELMAQGDMNEQPPALGFYETINEAYAYQLRGRAYLATGRPQEAIKDLNRSVELGSDDLEIFLFRGEAYQDIADNERAIQDFEHVITSTPVAGDNVLAEAYGNRGSIFAQQGKNSLALADYDKAIELDPTMGGLFFNRAQLYFEAGDYDRAMADYSKSIEIRPDHARSYHMRGQCFSFKQQLDAAIADYSKAIEIDPTVAVFYYDRAVDYLAKKEYIAAIADCTESIKLDPLYFRTYSLRGQAYLLKGENKNAIADFKKLLEFKLDSKSREYFENQIKLLEAKQ